jgi:hypothetical protein
VVEVQAVEVQVVTSGKVQTPECAFAWNDPIAYRGPYWLRCSKLEQHLYVFETHMR